MPLILLVAYGNVSRRDDGVAFHVIHRLRQRLGLPTSDPANVYDDLDHAPAILCAHQLTPEMGETLIAYDIVVFVDAHVAGVDRDQVHWEEVTPAYKPSMVSHHLKPDTLLAICRTLYGRCPKGYVLSILGTDFDFGEDLSPKTSALADEAVDRILELSQSKK